MGTAGVDAVFHVGALQGWGFPIPRRQVLLDTGLDHHSEIRYTEHLDTRLMDLELWKGISSYGTS